MMAFGGKESTVLEQYYGFIDKAEDCNNKAKAFEYAGIAYGGKVNALTNKGNTYKHRAIPFDRNGIAFKHEVDIYNKQVLSAILNKGRIMKAKYWLALMGIALLVGCMGYVQKPYLPGYDGKVPTVKSIELGNILFNDILWLESNTIYLLFQPDKKNKSNEVWSVDVQNGSVSKLGVNEMEEVVAIKNTLKKMEESIDTSSVAKKVAKGTLKVLGGLGGLGYENSEKGSGQIYSIKYETNRNYSYKLTHITEGSILSPGKQKSVLGIYIGSVVISSTLNGTHGTPPGFNQVWPLSPDGKCLIFINTLYFLDEPKKKGIILEKDIVVPNPEWTKMALIKRSFSGKATLLITDFDVTKL
jgi:hypothetical protein